MKEETTSTDFIKPKIESKREIVEKEKCKTCSIKSECINSKTLARPKQTLCNHLCGVAELTSKYLEDLGFSKESALALGTFLGWIHDLGKNTAQWQVYLLIDREKREVILDHSTAGAQYVYENRNNSETNSAKKIAVEIIANVIMSHHGGTCNFIGPSGENELKARINKNKEETRYVDSLNYHLYNGYIDKIKSLYPQAIDAVAQMIEKRNILSNPKTEQMNLLFLLKEILSCLKDADGLDAGKAENPTKYEKRYDGDYQSWDWFIEHLEKLLNKKTNSSTGKQKELNAIRMTLSNSCIKKASQEKGLYTVTMPTSAGKNFTCIRFSFYHGKHHNLKKVIYVSPFTTIIEQNSEEYREMFGEIDFEKLTEIITHDGGSVHNYVNEIKEMIKSISKEYVLEDHSAVTIKNENKSKEIEEKEIHDALERNWDSRIIATTFVRFLEVCYRYKRLSKLHSIANSIIIFDEPQKLPLHNLIFFKRIIKHLIDDLGCTVILSTATQNIISSGEIPIVDKTLEPVYKGELAQNVFKNTLFSGRVCVNDLNFYPNSKKKRKFNIEEHAELILEKLKEFGNVLAVVNTKKYAKNLHRLLKNLFQNQKVKIFLLYDHQPPIMRRRILSEIKACLKNNEPVVCVSTSLIECGLNISFKCAIRTMAGLESLIQTSGRVDRNWEYDCGHLFIIWAEDEDLRMIKEISEGRKTVFDLLLFDKDFNLKDFENPKNWALYVKKFYDENEEMKRKIDNVVCINDKGEHVEKGNKIAALSLFSNNIFLVEEYKRKHNGQLPETYMVSAPKIIEKIYNIINAPTIPLVVPHGDRGIEIIQELKTTDEYIDLKELQNYCINTYPNIFNKLMEANAIELVRESIYCLTDFRYYDSCEVGLIVPEKK